MKPKLRFKEFQDRLNTLCLKELATFSSGGTPSIGNPDFWDGGIPWISAASMTEKYLKKSERTLTKLGVQNGTRIASEGDLLVLVRGSMLFNKIPIGIAGTDVAFNQDVKAIKPKEKLLIGEYLYQWFLSRESFLLGKIVVTGMGAGKLDMEDLNAISVYLPTIPEQQKIASFLSAVDEKIRQLKRKKELLEKYKKGVMQQIFERKIRFKDEKGKAFPEWEEKRLSDVANRVTRKNKANYTNVLTISAQFGLISQLEFFNKSVAGKDLSKYYLLERDEFAYNKSYSTGYPMGAIKRLKRYEYGIVSTLYICFKFDDSVSLDFIEQYFENGYQNFEIEKVAQEGARNHGLLNIGVDDFFNINMTIPALTEQQKIASFLSSLDKKIELVSQQVEKAQEFKKGLLQQMFV